MITKKNFIEMMNLSEKFDAEITRWSDFGIDVFDLPISEIPWAMFTNWCNSNFDAEGQDWIDWYLWERKGINNNEVLSWHDGLEFTNVRWLFNIVIAIESCDFLCNICLTNKIFSKARRNNVSFIEVNFTFKICQNLFHLFTCF